ncbi:hypothetical protein IPF37_01685 [bacterium]|nr:MAG: hypothetical protein IPF37_01685 [bacterium]
MKNTKLFLALLMVTMLSIHTSVSATAQVVEVDGVMMPSAERKLNFESVFTIDNLANQVPVDMTVAGKPLAAFAAGVVTLFGVKGLWAFWDALANQEVSLSVLIDNALVNKATELSVAAAPYSPGLMCWPIFSAIDNVLYRRTTLGLYESAYKLFAQVAKEISNDNIAGFLFTQKDRIVIEAQLRFGGEENAMRTAQNVAGRQADDLMNALTLVKKALHKAKDDAEVNACVDLKKAIELLYKTVNDRRMSIASAFNAQAEKAAERARVAQGAARWRNEAADNRFGFGNELASRPYMLPGVVPPVANRAGNAGNNAR